MSITKKTTYLGMFIGLSILGSLTPKLGLTSIGFDSAPAFMATLLLGGSYGAIVGAVGHMLSATMGGYPLGIGIHLVIAFVMAMTMLLFGKAYTYGMHRWQPMTISHQLYVDIVATIGGFIGNVIIGVTVTIFFMDMSTHFTMSRGALLTVGGFLATIVSIGYFLNVLLALAIFNVIKSYVK